MIEHHTQASHRHNARVGLVLFFLYLILYAGFVGVFAYDYKIMARPIFVGVNLAIVWGMALIVAAIVLAIIYMFLCEPEIAPIQSSDAASDQLNRGKPIDDQSTPRDLPPSESA